MKNSFMLLLCFGLLQVALAQKSEIVYQVIFKGAKIGTLHAVEEKADKKSIFDLSTKTDAKVLMMSVHVESEVKATFVDGLLISGTAYRHASRGSEDVQAHVIRSTSNGYQKERNGKKGIIENTKIIFCVVNLFFREPKGMNKIFSNMYADFLSVKQISPGKYQVTTPDNKNSYYTYQNGKLIKVESETPLGKVESNRI
jgi:hypothetical protein